MNLPDYERRWEAIEDAGKIIEICTRRGEKPVYMQIVGLSEADAEKILRKTSTRSNVPEALRVAHIVASGLSQLKEKESGDG